MSLKDCVKLVKKLDPDDRAAFSAEFDQLVKGGIPPEEAYTEAAEALIETILVERNELADMISAEGGRIDKLTLENIVNPQSYRPRRVTGTAADITNVTADEFDALLEEVAPTPKKAKPVPKEPAPRPAKDGMTAEAAQNWIRDHRAKKKIQKQKVKQLRQVAKAAEIPGYSKMPKQELIDNLMEWYDAQLLAQLPEPYPGQRAALALRAGVYNRADSAMGVVVNSEDPAIGAWARHYGASVEKRADTYEGGKTDKGYHFEGLSAFERFLSDYAGRRMREYMSPTGGELAPMPYLDESQTFMEGDRVVIAPDLPEQAPIQGEIVGSEIDMVGKRVYEVRYDDPDTGQTETSTFSPQYLSLRKPPDKKATEMLANAAKHGVKGADAALTGLAELFGGKGKFSSGFTFDEETYARAKPYFKEALEEFVASGKSLKEFLQFIVENLGEGIKPYLREFHQDVQAGNITVRGVNDVQPTPQEPAGARELRGEPADQADTAAAGAPDAEVSVETDQRPRAEEGTAPGRIGVPVDSTIPAGEQVDTDILGSTGEFESVASTTGREDTGRSAAAGAAGVSTPTPGSKSAATAARQTAERVKLKPTVSTWIQSDPQNIAESLPPLFPEQHDDVAFAETRLFDNDARGVMFTNGTGTGKTFTGLGIIKRFVMQGKDNVLIVVPGEKVASDWIKTGRVVDVDITKLKNIKDAGQGVVVTTYANLADNNAVVERDWDLVVHDEAHKLSENMRGEPTNALNKSRAITGHPDGAGYYAAAKEADLLDEIAGINSQIKEMRKAETIDMEKYNKLSEQQEGLNEIWRQRLATHRANRAELWETRTPKRLDLTATPFAYDKSVDHAEGFLFEYDRSLDQNQGYNSPGAKEAFFMEHFGYRMVTNKLTTPEAEVDSGLMEREFNQWLKGEGALRGRVLTVDHDYSREFVAIDDLVGKKIDDGWDTIRKRSMDKNNPLAKGYEMMDKQLRKNFNYHARVRMLEAIKAKHAVDRARQHMALGRKVVLFHSRIQGGTMNPFHLFAGAAAMADATEVATTDEELALYQRAAEEFVNERNDLMTLDINTVRPLDLFAQEFGDQMTVYNGTITNTQKRENPDKFNADEGEIQVIAVQDQGGKEGISLHDATGVNQRVLINLGLPVQPTQAIQIEGRIYRVGQQSNAIFEYFNTGTNFERMTFAEKISQRASTAENLALGEQARTLKDSFIDAYEDPTYEAPHDGQGLGGKDIDQANWAATSEFERAKTHYFGTLKTKGRRDQRAGLDYFPTPEPLGVKMVEWAHTRANDSVLEPSAGHGAIARYFPENVNATMVEPSSELLSKLALRAPGNHRQMMFEDLDVGGNKYNAIVMNPPFGSGGATAVAHLHKAMHHLKNGGRIVALIPEGPAADKKFDNMFYGKEGELEAMREKIKAKRKAKESYASEARRVDDLTKFFLRASISLPPVTFTRAGTAVRARVVVIDRNLNPNAVMRQKPPLELHADSINELFDKIEGISVPDRTKLERTPEEYLEAEGLFITHDEAGERWRISGKTYDHRQAIKSALGEDVTYQNGLWTSTVDPIDALYAELTAPQEVVEAETAPATQAEIAAAAAAMMSQQQTPAPQPPAELGGLVVKKTTTKTGKEVWEVSGNTREHKDMLKQLGGRWYNPKKVWTFYDADPTESISSQLQKPLALRDRRAGGATVRRVKQWLKTPLKRISSRVPVKVVQTTSDIKTQYELPTDGRGWYIDGTVYLVADNIRTRQDAIVALTHELVGHLGTEGVLGRKKMNELVGDIVNMKVEEMLSPGTHPELGRILEKLRQNYSDAEGNYTLNPKDEAKEVIAAIAEKKPRIGPFVEVYNKIINWFKQWAARLGIADPDMAKIDDALIRAVDFVKAPPPHYTGEGPDGVAAMRVYHVSTEEFESFEVEKATKSKGVGMMNYGFGHYFTGMKEAANFFERQFEAEGRTPIQYEAWIAPTENELMRWQDEYSMQPQNVQNALSLMLDMPPTRFEALDMTGGAAYRKAEREIKGGTALGNTIKDIARTRGLDVDAMQPDQIVSTALTQLGVRGVRYTEKFGTRLQGFSYVVFSDDDVSVLRRARQPRVDVDVQGPLAMRRRPRQEPRPGEDRAEFERYKKLGLQGKETWLERIKALRESGVSEAIDSATARGYEGLFDGLIELKRKEIEAGVGVGANDYENSAYVSARLATGVADTMSAILHFGAPQWQAGVVQGIENTRGLLPMFDDLGIDKLNDWLMWMAANRAQELMAEGRERNLSQEDIRAGLAKAEGNEELFNRIKNEFAFFNKMMLNFAEEAGLIDPVKRAEWESDWYVPFYRQSEDEIGAPRLKRGLSHQEAGIRRLFGAELPTNDLLENILTNWLKLADASMKNHALRLMVDNFEGKTDLDNYEYITREFLRFTKALVPRSEIRKRIVADRDFAQRIAQYLGMDETANNLQIINEVNQIPAEGFEELWAVTAPKDPDVIRIKRNGKNEYWRVHVPGLLRAVGHISEQGSQSKAMKAGRYMKRLLTTGVTASPDFMLRNFIRDAAHAWAINPDGFTFAKDSVTGLTKAMRDDPLYQAAMFAGASFQGGYVHATDPEASAQILRRELEKSGLTDTEVRSHMKSIVSTPKLLFDVSMQGWQHYRTWGDKVENANRIATLQAALDSGKPMAQALFESKDLMDYSRRGNYAALIWFTDLIPFLNARMQGIDKLGRAMKQHPKMVTKKLGYLIAFTALLALLNDDEEEYKELPDWEKDAYWHVFVDMGGERAEHIRIPKPFELGAIATVFERAQRAWILRSQPSEKFLWSLRHNLMETLNVNPIPQFALPVAEVAMNRSFYFDQPIESLSDEQVLPYRRFNNFTSNTAMELGDTALAKWIGVSPKQLQHLWNGYTGTMGAYALKATDMLLTRPLGNHPDREAIRPHDMPVVRSVYQGTRVKGTQWATDFYDRMKEVDQLHGTMRDLLASGERAEARAFREENKDKLKYRGMMMRVRKNFSQLRKKRDKIMESTELTPAQKYTQMQAVQMRINALAKKIEAATRPGWE